MANEYVKEITVDNFDELIKENDTVLVDFWAEWCQPCLMLGPVIDKLAEEFDGKAVVGKVNVDDNQELGAKFNVSSIPTVLIIKNGEVADQIVGVNPEARYREALETAGAAS